MTLSQVTYDHPHLDAGVDVFFCLSVDVLFVISPEAIK